MSCEKQFKILWGNLPQLFFLLLSPIKDVSFEGMRPLKIIMFPRSSEAKPLLRGDLEEWLPESTSGVLLSKCRLFKTQEPYSSATAVSQWNGEGDEELRSQTIWGGMCRWEKNSLCCYNSVQNTELGGTLTEIGSLSLEKKAFIWSSKGT